MKKRILASGTAGKLRENQAMLVSIAKRARPCRMSKTERGCLITNADLQPNLGGGVLRLDDRGPVRQMSGG